MFGSFFEGGLGDFANKLYETIAPLSSPLVEFEALLKRGDLYTANQMINRSENPLDIHNPDASGVYAIHAACRAGSFEMVQTLLSSNAPLLVTDYEGNTTLHYAAMGPSLDIVKFVVSQGADVSALNKNGQSSYDVATLHVIRGYLLPLFLHATEPEDQQQHQGGFGSIESQSAYSTMSAPPPMTSTPPPSFEPPPSNNNSSTVFHHPSSVPPPSSSSSSFQSNDPYSVPYSPYALNSLPSASRSTSGGSNSNRPLPPDGFLTSASNKDLQRKYGHTSSNMQQFGAPPSSSSPPFSAPPPSSSSPPPSFSPPPSSSSSSENGLTDVSF